jgi:hypothetical protein
MILDWATLRQQECSSFNFLNVLCALFAHRCKDQDKVKSLRDILEECYERSRRRNALVHSFWYPEKDQGVSVRFKILVDRGKQPYKEDQEVMSGQLLEREAEMCQLTRERLQEFLTSFEK